MASYRFKAFGIYPEDRADDLPEGVFCRDGGMNWQIAGVVTADDEEQASRKVDEYVQAYGFGWSWDGIDIDEEDD